MPYLIELLNDKELRTVVVIESLEKIGSDATAAVPSLKKIVLNGGGSEENERLRSFAVRALKKIQGANE